MVKFLLEHLEKSGCAVGDGFIKAVHCEKKIAGGYTRGGGVLYILHFPFIFISFIENGFDFYTWEQLQFCN